MKFLLKRQVLSIILVIAILIVMAFGVIQFRSALEYEVSNSAESYLYETSNLYASTFRTKLNDQLVMLESQARYFADVDLTDYNLMKSTIMSTRGVGDFKRIAVADSSGTTMNYNGNSSGNIMMKDYFKNAMKGEETVSSSITVDEDGENVLVLAVPIIQNGVAVGVITGTFNQSVLQNLFAVDAFGGEGYFYVINGDGTIIVNNKNKNKLLNKDNIYDFIGLDEVVSDIPADSLKKDVITGESSIMHYAYGSQERIIVYSPIGLHNWYVISVMPSSVVSSQTNEISKLVTILFIFFLAIIGLFVVLAALLVRRSRNIEKDNERYRIVNTQTQSVVFEYDINSQKLELSGSTDFIMCGGVSVFNGSKCEDIFKVIHNDDMGFRAQLKDITKGKIERFSAEIRVLCTGERYYWFRIQGTLIRNAAGAASKVIGNGVNVDQQIVEELSLKSRAERDLLTGLYNKVTFENYVEAAAKDAPAGSVYAFYIIDLDNFKWVNDRLGHAMGDKVLCNTGISLNLVFTERDYIGRIGGDEFAVLLMLPESERENAHAIAESKAEKLLAAIRHTYSDEKNSVSVSASIGISYFSEHGRQYDSLYKNADKALYYSKEHGRNRFTVYNEKLLRREEN